MKGLFGESCIGLKGFAGFHGFDRCVDQLSSAYNPTHVKTNNNVKISLFIKKISFHQSILGSTVSFFPQHLQCIPVLNGIRPTH